MKNFQKSLIANLTKGIQIAPNIRKIRLAIKSKARGKSSGARIITYTILSEEKDNTIVLLLIYDKEKNASVKKDIIKDIVTELYDSTQ